MSNPFENNFNPAAMFQLVQQQRAREQAELDRHQQQLMQADAIRRQVEDTKKQDIERDFSRGLQAIAADANLDKIGGMLTSLPPSHMTALKEFQRTRRATASKEEQSKQLPGLAQLVAGAKTPQEEMAAKTGVGNLIQNTPEEFRGDFANQLTALAGQNRVVDRQGLEQEYRAESRARAAEERGRVFSLASAGQQPFVATAAAAIAGDPDGTKGQLKLVNEQAEQQFGKNAPIVMSQARTAALAGEISDLAYRDKVATWKADGANDFLSKRLADNPGKEGQVAWRSPYLGVYARGSEAGEPHNQHLLSIGPYQMFQQVDAALDELARIGNIHAFTGPVTAMTRITGGNASPVVSAYMSLADLLTLSVVNSLSGKQFTDKQMEFIRGTLPLLQEIRMVNGKLNPAVMGRIRQVENLVTNSLTAPFDHEDKGRIEETLRQRSTELRARALTNPVIPDGLDISTLNKPEATGPGARSSQGWQSIMEP